MERKVLDTVLMEFDGVLAETAGVRRMAICAILGEEGIVLSDAEYRSACAGRATAEAVRGAVALRTVSLDETMLDLLTVRVERAFSEYVGKGLMLTDGATEMVERLAGRARLGIVTRAYRRDVEFVVALARLEHAFSCIVGSEDAYPPKPNPAPYLAALRRLERTRAVPPNGVVVALEDGIAGIQSAAGAGLRCVAVGDLPAHVAMEADALIPTITGLGAERLERLVVRSGESFA